MGDERFVIVGGGIVGASVAYHLSIRSDADIVVIERGELASETTYWSTAMIGVSGPEPYHRLQEYGFRLYNEFFEDPASSVRYRQSGRLRVATSEQGARALESCAAGTSASMDEPGNLNPASVANSPLEYVPGENLTDRFILPVLDTASVEGALYRPLYGHILDESRTLGARALAFEFIERARENGVRFETGVEVTDIYADGGSVSGIETNQSGRIDADTVVCAAGPWTGSLARLAGVELPLGHVVSCVFALELADPLPCSLPMIKVHEAGVGIHPKQDDRVLVTYTPDDQELPQGVDPPDAVDMASDAVRDTALSVARELLPVLADATLADEWVGLA